MKAFITMFEKRGLLQIDRPLAKYTTWRVGGNADIIFSPCDEGALVDCIGYLMSAKIPYKVIGKGSNLLVADAGFRGVIILLDKLKPFIMQVSLTRFEISAGMGLQQVSRYLALNGYTGHEYFSGIPGTIGGAIVMNAGTPSGEISDALIQCRVLTEKGEIVNLSHKQLSFEYRNSIIKNSNTIIITGDFYFEKEQVVGESLELIKKQKQIRQSKQPLNQPSCGSVFQNPEGHFAGNIIESIGLKGYKIGGAQVSPMHANFIVNTGEATGADIYNLIEYVKLAVLQETNCSLKTEVEYLGW
ncbi:MAG: UDP-N-acetylmuramate dehydrogenase [Culicoidibacterales bacterium]